VCLQIDGHLAADIIIGYYDRTNFTDGSSSYVDDSDSLPPLDTTLMLEETPLTAHLLQLQQQQFSSSSSGDRTLQLQPQQQQQQQPRQLQHRLTDVQLATALLQRSLSVAISDLDGLTYGDSPHDDVDSDVSSSDDDSSESDANASRSKSATATSATTATAKQQREALLRSPSQQQIQQQLQRSQRSVHGSSSIRSGSQSPKLQNINNRSRRRRHRHEALHSSAGASALSSTGGITAVATQQLDSLLLDVSNSRTVLNAEQQALVEAAAAVSRRDAAVQACAAAYNRGAMSGADFIEQLGIALVGCAAMHAMCHLAVVYPS
jgi:hypothetical protein